MIENESDRTVYDIAIEWADERGDSDLKERLQQLKDDDSLQVARAKAVLSELTGGLRECPFEERASRIDSVIQKNLDSNSIWDFLLLCGDHWSSLRKIAFDQIARTNLAKAGALAKLANDPKQKDKTMVRECWDAWQKHPEYYKGKAAFARDMRDKFQNLESQPVIEGWCRTWERESKPSLS